MKLKLSYSSKDEIPTEYQALYTEKDGVWNLTGVDIPAPKDGDVARLQEALKNERTAHSATKEKLRAFDGINPETVHTELDEIVELRAKVEAGGKGIDDDKIDKIVESRMARKIAPITRENEQLKNKLATYVKEVTDLKGNITKSKVINTLSKAAQEAKVLGSAIDDVLMYSDKFDVTEDGAVIHKEVGLTADVWFQDMKEKRPHWWPTSTGGGATGSGVGGTAANNPWSKANWNKTEQAKMVSEQGMTKAAMYAKQAGVEVHATKPLDK